MKKEDGNVQTGQPAQAKKKVTVKKKKLTGPKFASMHTPSVEPIMKKRLLTVLFIGCNGDFWKFARRHLPSYGFRAARAKDIDDAALLIKGRVKPAAIVLGHEIDGGEGEQINVLKRLKQLDQSIKVIYVTESDNPNSALIIALGADDIISRDQAKPKALSQRIENVLLLRQLFKEQGSPPVICEIQDGNVKEVELKKMIETMTRFSYKFDLHQRQNRHYAIMNVILTSYSNYFGSSILDVGCGTAHPMRQYIRNIMVPEFAAVPRLRGLTKILSIDSTVQMLIQAREGYMRLMTHHEDTLKDNLQVDFAMADILDITPESLQSKGYDRVDTILASYFIHWAIEKEAAVRRMAELLCKGGRFITVEEWPLVVTPGPHMSESLAKRIQKDSSPIGRKNYYSLLRKYGLKDVKEGVVVVKIDGYHKMYGNVFEKV